MEEKTENFLLEADDLDNISEEEMNELKELVDEYTEMLQDHDDELNDILDKINNTAVYKELGIQIGVSSEYMYSIGER